MLIGDFYVSFYKNQLYIWLHLTFKMKKEQSAILKVGVTGGIGSGKTTVCRVFEKLGIPLFNADLEASKLMNNDVFLIAEIKKTFGQDIYDENNTLRRKNLSAMVFNNQDLLMHLNALVHPAVFRHFAIWHARQANVPYVIKEAAIMFESGADKELDLIIQVSAPETLRIKRVCLRDGVPPESVQLRIQAQISDKEREERSDFILTNDDEQLLLPQILKVHEILTAQ